MLRWVAVGAATVVAMVGWRRMQAQVARGRRDKEKIVLHVTSWEGMRVLSASKLERWISRVKEAKSSRFAPIEMEISEETFRSLLKRRNVTIHGFGSGELGRGQFFTHVQFMITKPGLNLYDPKQFPFFAIAQSDQAIAHISVPISKVLRVAQHLPPPSCRIVMIWSPGRCGSTLLTQLLHLHPSVVTISEPAALFNLSRLLAPSHARPDCGDYGRKDTRQLMEAVTKLMLKDFIGQQVVCIKTITTSMCLAETFRDSFPDSKAIFLYRDAKPSVASFFKTFSINNDPYVEKLKPHWRLYSLKDQLVLLWVSMRSSRDHALWRQCWQMRWRWFALVPRRLAWLTSLGFCRTMHAPAMDVCVFWTSMMRWGLDLLHKSDGWIRSLKYDEMVAKPQAVAEALFELCGLQVHEEMMARLQQIMSEDSQKNSKAARELLEDVKLEFTQERLDRYEFVFKAFG
ncbi:hypothetical protein GUITHDRAFT_105746 [Guillardia theta CCMP2712]|uniref:Sulfotransferase domain-containing protein n=1 Tax=Guillardia theta (strain CCMP2712) TaxID=905079 RepID=L1JJC5_GUITC|nr:hypothetical protein GUITHDRAFT_105746 [Guillardia theta CCMP2712]EKX48601.1 hypothetical protein GUITHDRAFT_105746 [Guillardia theta CCMP2712]|eukprot:XP_005835581.1 hypothetical protein GUITHDRAFT_105746 [Guillardia theta CCMP2712]